MIFYIFKSKINILYKNYFYIYKKYLYILIKIFIRNIGMSIYIKTLDFYI